MKNSPSPTIVRSRPTAYVKGFRRVVCCLCGCPCFWLGEAIRVDMAEGGYRIVHACLACVRRFRLGVAHSSPVNHGSSIKAA